MAPLLVPSAPLPSQFPCPGQFGRYRVDSLIAHGGMGSVYEVHDDVLKMPLALKATWHFRTRSRSPIPAIRFMGDAFACCRPAEPCRRPAMFG